MTSALVADGAALVRFDCFTSERRVGSMTSQTGECSIAFTKANGVTEVIRLVTRVQEFDESVSFPSSGGLR